MLGRRAVGERCVRSLLVVDALEVTEPVELLAQATRRRRGGIAQQRQVQPFEPAVLLRLAGRNALRQHARLDHLDRQPREAARTARGERRPIIGAQPLRQSVFTERRIEHRPDMLGVVAVERLAAQEIAAVRVAQGKRLAVRPVASQEPALEINAPQVIRAVAGTERCARGRRAAAQLAPHRQSCAVEQHADRARCRPGHRGIVPRQAKRAP